MVNMTEITIRPPNWRTVPLPDGASVELFRSASLGLATEEEHQNCPEELLWVDLRTPFEISGEEQLTIPAGWSRVNINLTPGANIAPHELAEMTERFRNGSITFGDFYIQMLLNNRAEIADVMRAISTTPSAAVIACQAGRDRTGVAVALILLIAGVDREVIIADYLATNHDLDRFLDRNNSNSAQSITFDLTCKAEDLERALDHIESCGGVRSYLAEAGITPAEFDLLQTVLTQQTHESAVSTNA